MSRVVANGGESSGIDPDLEDKLAVALQDFMIGSDELIAIRDSQRKFKIGNSRSGVANINAAHLSVSDGTNMQIGTAADIEFDFLIVGNIPQRRLVQQQRGI